MRFNLGVMIEALTNARGLAARSFASLVSLLATVYRG